MLGGYFDPWSLDIGIDASDNADDDVETTDNHTIGTTF